MNCHVEKADLSIPVSNWGKPVADVPKGAARSSIPNPVLMGLYVTGIRRPYSALGRTDQTAEVERREIIGMSLCAADQFHRSIGFHE